MFGFFRSNRFNPKKGIRARVYERHPCCSIAKLDVAMHATTLDGLILELSCGGALFREASSYILDRRGSAVVVHMGGFSRAATIVNVRVEGYGLRWVTPISQSLLDELRNDHRLDLILSAA